MPLPSFHVSMRAPRLWSIPRAAAYGAGIGAVAGLFKTIGPLHAAAPAFAHGLEIAAVTAAFSALCAASAYLRNVLARRFIWPDIR
jgi:hypothetical protein